MTMAASDDTDLITLDAAAERVRLVVNAMALRRGLPIEPR